MATNNTPQAGQFVKIMEWVGRIVDVAVSPTRTMILVESPKGIFRNHRPEWLEYDPNLVKSATRDEYLADINLYLKRTERNLEELVGMRKRVEQEDAHVSA